MAGKSGLIIVGLGALAAFLFLKKGKDFKNLDTSIDSISAKKSGSNIILNIKLAIYNPNQENLSISRFLGNVFHDKTRIADIDLNSATGIILKARETNMLTVPVTIPIARLTANILEALSNLLSKAPTVLILKGVIYAENLRVPIEEKFDLNLKV